MALTKTQVSELYVAIFNRASEGTGNTYWQGEGSAAEVAQKMLDTVDAKEYFGTAIDDDKAFIEHIYINTLGKTYAEDAEGIDFWVARLANGESRGEVVAALVVAATDPKYAGTAAQKQFLNRVEVSNYAADNIQNVPENYKQTLGFNGDLVVTENPGTISPAKKAVQELAVETDGGSKGETFLLTEGRDVLTGTAGDDTFVGLVGQNQNGSISNALATGDRIDGGAGRDKIEASIMEDQEVDSGTDTTIAPRTTSVEEVFLEVQDMNSLGGVTVDATRMEGVEEFWSDFSRDDLNINNINLRGSNVNITKDVTFGLKDVEYDAGLNAYFDTEALKREAPGVTGSQLRINLMDLGTEASPYDEASPLGQLNVNGFRFTVDGVEKEIKSQAIDDAVTYAELFAAVQTAIAEAAQTDPDLNGLEVSIEENGFNTAPLVALLPNGGSAAQSGDSIVIRDENGRTLDGTTFIQEGNTTEFTLYGRYSEEAPTIVSKLIESNLVLDNAGRGSIAGEVNIAGSSNSDEGVEKINVVVDRDSAIASLSSKGLSGAGSHHLDEIEVTSTGANGSVDLGEIVDVQNFNSTAFKGAELSVSANVTESFDDHYYNTSNANDVLSFQADAEKTASSEYSLNINTGGGNDVVNVYTTNGFVSNGSASQFADAVELMNTRINTGAGDDEINLGTTNLGYGAAIVDAGAGNDFVKTDNSGDKAVFLVNADPATSSTPAPGLGVSVNGLGNKTHNVFKTKVQVEFMGIKTDWVEIDYSNYQTTSRNINDAIKEAIANDNELSKLLDVEDVRNEGLVVRSTIDRALTNTDFSVNFLAPKQTDGTNAVADFYDFEAQSTVSDQELRAAWEKYTNSNWAGGSTGFPGSDEDDVLTGTNGINDLVNGLAGTGGAYESTAARNVETGSNSTALTHNVVMASAGDDVLVLSTNVNGGYDTVKFEGNFGHDTIINFNTNTGGGTVRDVLDFTSYLDAAAANRGSSASSNPKYIDQNIGYSFLNGNDITVGNAASDFGYHNSVSLVDLSAIWGDLTTAVGAANTPEDFSEITADQIKKALEEANSGGGADVNLDGMKSVLLVGNDQNIEIDTNGNAILNGADDNEHALVFTVTTKVASNGDVSFDVVKVGSFQLAQAFSNLGNLSADGFRGTAEWATTEKAFELALNDDVIVDPTDPTDPTVPVDPVEREFDLVYDVADLLTYNADEGDVLFQFSASASQQFVVIQNFTVGDAVALDAANAEPAYVGVDGTSTIEIQYGEFGAGWYTSFTNVDADLVAAVADAESNEAALEVLNTAWSVEDAGWLL